MTSQLPLDLQLPVRLSNAYFVPHSGVIEALSVLRQAVESQRENPNFCFYRLSGPSGCGKTALLNLLEEEANDGSPFFCFDADVDWNEERNIARFIDAYESLKADGGLLLVVDSPVINPHVTSRMRAALELPLHFPAEEELPSLLDALLEKRGLKFDDAKRSYLLNRLPANPLSLSSILAKIDALSLGEGKQLTLQRLREALSAFEAREGEAKSVEEDD